MPRGDPHHELVPANGPAYLELDSSSRAKFDSVTSFIYLRFWARVALFVMKGKDFPPRNKRDSPLFYVQDQYDAGFLMRWGLRKPYEDSLSNNFRLTITV